MRYDFYFFFFFFSSRRRHTRLTCDWSSDVCSSDLLEHEHLAEQQFLRRRSKVLDRPGKLLLDARAIRGHARGERGGAEERSEERRVGKECRCRWGAEQ